MEGSVYKKNRNLLQGICTCLEYCFDELKRQQLNFYVENAFFIQFNYFEQPSTGV